MRIKIVLLFLAAAILCMTSWLVHVPPPSHADEIPEKYRDTVHKALEYLVQQQHKDGHWEGDGGKHPIAMTSLVGVALLMEIDNVGRPSFSAGAPKAKYADQMRKAADWLMSKSNAKRDGLIYADHPSETNRYMQGHALATLFLAGMLQQEQDETQRKKLTEVVTRAVKYIGKAQSTQGGWHDTSKAEGHDFANVAATILQIQALQAAENANVAVPNDCLGDAQEYMKVALQKWDEMPKPNDGAGRQLETAGALASAFRTGRFTLAARPNKDPLHEKRLTFCKTRIPMGVNIQFGRDELVHYYYAQVMFDHEWAAYRSAVFDYLRSKQNKDGSWPSADGLGVGPVYSTAVWCTVLQTDKKSHPARPRELERITR